MKQIRIPYGRGHIALSLEESRLAGVLEPRHGQGAAAPDAVELVRAALRQPIASERLRDMAAGKRRILIITSDHTRPMPSAVTMPALLEEIRSGSAEAEIRILIATGTHRPMTDAEMRARFGDSIVDAETIDNHRCDEAEWMVFKGKLPSGGELWLHGWVDWAELVVAEGFIEPHLFAGFSGGRKSILPGIASRRTVLYNHNAGFIRHPLATHGSLKGNPLHEDMLFASRAASLRFILNVVLDDQKRIASVYAGDPEEAHAKGCEDCLARTSVQRVEADIVVTSNGGYPLDQNIYQSVKGMTSAEVCVRQGGVIILCAALGDGVGGDAFYRWFLKAESSQAVAQSIEHVPAEETTEDQWEAQLLARVLNKAAVVFVTGEENKGIVEDMHMTWAATLEDAITIAEGMVGEGSRIAVIPDGVGVIVHK